MARKPDPNALLSDLQPKDGALRVMPLGGIGKIGANCTILEYNGDMVLVDCGQMMPDEEMLGVDYVIPDISYIKERAGRLLAIVLTHAHEDHVGALPYILPQLPENIPVYGSEFTVALLKEKLKEHKLKPNLKLMTARNRFALGKYFSVEPLAVTHSMIDCFALAITTPIGTAIHSGDYKIDPAPQDGVYFDFHGFAKYAEGQDEGVLLLLGDSTNAENHGTCPSESAVAPALKRIFREATGQIIVSCFASSMHRIQMVMNLAAEFGRTVFTAGLNMGRNIRVASGIHALEIACDYEDDIEKMKGTPANKRVLLTTGSQGEPDSALSRLATGEYRGATVQAGDTVVISARMIPGNEKSIYHMVNHFSRKGARVHHIGNTPGIHVSGHAYRDDMKHLINLVNPEFLVPIHGEHRHLAAHADVAWEAGMPKEDVVMIQEGDCLEVTPFAARVIGKIPHGRVYVDGKGIGDVEEVVLRDRRYLSEDGVVMIVLSVDQETGEVLYGPYLHQRGFAKDEEAAAILDDAQQAVLDTYNAMPAEAKEETQMVQDAVKKALREFLKKRTRRFPVILPLVMEI